MLRTAALALALVLGACATDPAPTASPGASGTPVSPPVATPVSTPSAEPPASGGPSPSATPFPVRESAEADALYRRTDTCTNPEIGYTVTFPDDWYTNTAIGDQAACSWFTPDFFEVDALGQMPEEIWIAIGLVEGIIGYNMLNPTEAGDEVEIDGYAGHWAEFRLLEDINDTDSDDLNYHYVVPINREGPTLVATTGVDMADDYELAKAVLDRIMASMELNPVAAGMPTLPDEPTGPLISGDPVTDEDADGSFRLTLEADQDRYRAGQEILLRATLTYLGPADAVVARGSSTPGLIGFAMEREDPPIRMSPAFTTDCAPHEMTRDHPVEYPMAKSGGELRLPAGAWTISAAGGWYIGDCGSGDLHELSASVTVVVEP